MSNTPHALVDEFPLQKDRIHELKLSDPHFKKLFDQYHDVNDAIHRAETNVEPMDQFAEETLRKERLSLKDQIAAIIS